MLGAASIAVAALALLQPGFDPVFLTMLSAAHGTDLSHHGWVVGATQSGMAAGSLVVLRAGSRLPPALFPIAALCALVASLLTGTIGDTASLLAIRGTYGLAMGIIYTQAMSSAAAARPNGAYGAVFLTQLIIATIVALLLPALAERASPRLALATLALVPAICLALILSGKVAGLSTVPQPIAENMQVTVHSDRSGWALAAASLLFICSTMMVWSFTGALATAAGISDDAIGLAVAMGSIVGAVTALFVMREQPVIPLPVTGILSALALLSPIFATAIGGERLFTGAVILLNIGSTAIIIRTSGMATARARSMLFRRLVAATHSMGMILGPVTGSLLTTRWGDPGLTTGAMTTLTLGCVALLLARYWEGPLCTAQPVKSR